MLLPACGRSELHEEGDSAILLDERESIAPAQIVSPGPDAGLPSNAPFRMKFAPHFGSFRANAGPDLVAQIEFGAAQGFRAWEDNSLQTRAPAVQERIAEALRSNDIEMGVFTIASGAGYLRPTIATGEEGEVREFLAEVRGRLDLARLVRAKWVMVNPGMMDSRLELPIQLAHVIEALRRAVEIVAPQDLIMVLEPTNSVGRAPRVLETMDAGFLICRAVASPHLKLLFDVYQQQVMRGNIVNAIDECWSEIAYFQIADHPGRAEPMTGEINYVNVLRHIHARGYEGIVGMEHQARDQSAAGELAMIAAYRALDAEL